MLSSNDTDAASDDVSEQFADMPQALAHAEGSGKASLNVSAFVQMVARTFGKPLHRYLVRRLKDAQQARDVAQDAFERLLHVQDAGIIRAPQAYLFRIASNLIWDLRQRERNSVVIFDSRIADRQADRVAGCAMNELGEQISAGEQLEAMLARLPPLYSAVLIMRKRDGASYEEIARALRISIHTVKKYLFRAVKQCRVIRAEPEIDLAATADTPLTSKPRKTLL